MYPVFLKALRAQIREARSAGRKVVADVAVYFDLGAPDLGMPVVLVNAPVAERVRRLVAKGLPRPRALARAKALRFGPRERSRADLVLDGTKAGDSLLAELERGLARFHSGAPAPSAPKRKDP